jgi:hypothetical protein
MYVLATVFLVVGFLLALSFQLSFVSSWLSASGANAGDVVLGVAFLVGGVLTVTMARRVRLEMTATSLLVQNMLRAYRVELSEILSVRPSRLGVNIGYHRDGRGHTLSATAGESLIDPIMFPRLATRSRWVANAITARLPNQPKAAPDEPPR